MGKKKRILDKVIMGAIIGGAIGSVLGATMAPKKSKDASRKIFTKVKQWTTKVLRKKEADTMKEIPSEHDQE